jgi:hypothetical protein
MLADIRFPAYSGFNEKTMQFVFLHTIYDTEFEETISSNTMLTHMERILSVINVYEKRKLDVALNIVLYWLYLNRNFGFRMSVCVDWLKDYHTIIYAKYRDDIERYLGML